MALDAIEPQPKGRIRKVGRPQGSHAEATRRDIIFAARRLIAENGGTLVAFEAIAAAAGVSRTALYYYFPSKADLANAVLMSSIDWQWWRRAIEDASQADSFSEKLRHVLHAGIEGTVEAREQGAISYFNLVGASETDDELRAILRIYVTDMRESLLGLVEEGMRQGSLPAATDKAEAVESIMGLMWSVASGMANSPNAKVTEQIMKAVDFICSNTIGAGIPLTE